MHETQGEVYGQKAAYVGDRAYLGGGQITGAIQGANTAPATPTLVRALSAIDELNKRLYSVLNQSVEIAQAVGGPYPANGGQALKDAPPVSAMQRLNDAINTAHSTLTDIEAAGSAIRRALGA